MCIKEIENTKCRVDVDNCNSWELIIDYKKKKNWIRKKNGKRETKRKKVIDWTWRVHPSSLLFPLISFPSLHSQLSRYSRLTQEHREEKILRILNTWCDLNSKTIPVFLSFWVLFLQCFFAAIYMYIQNLSTRGNWITEIQ